MKGTGHEVCLLLGSNINPELNLPLAISLLNQQVTLLRASSVWESEAIGSNGPNFLNMALLVRCSFEAGYLKEEVIRRIEAQLGRERIQDKNAPRTMDIDMITFDDQLIEPHLWDVAFRAVPVAQVLPGYFSESGQNLQAIAASMVGAGMVKLRPDVKVGLTIRQEDMASIRPNHIP